MVGTTCIVVLSLEKSSQSQERRDEGRKEGREGGREEGREVKLNFLSSGNKVKNKLKGSEAENVIRERKKSGCKAADASLG